MPRRFEVSSKDGVVEIYADRKLVGSGFNLQEAVEAASPDGGNLLPVGIGDSIDCDDTISEFQLAKLITRDFEAEVACEKVADGYWGRIDEAQEPLNLGNLINGKSWGWVGDFNGDAEFSTRYFLVPSAIRPAGSLIFKHFMFGWFLNFMWFAPGFVLCSSYADENDDGFSTIDIDEELDLGNGLSSLAAVAEDFQHYDRCPVCNENAANDEGAWEVDAVVSEAATPGDVLNMVAFLWAPCDEHSGDCTVDELNETWVWSKNSWVKQ